MPDSLGASCHTLGSNTRLIPALVTSAPAYQPLAWRFARWRSGACAGTCRDRQLSASAWRTFGL